MSIFNKTLTIDFGNSYDLPEIKLVQGEAKARVVHLKLADTDTAVNLTGCTARIYILPYGETTPLYEDLTIITAASGKVDYTVSGNAAAVAGAGKFWIEIIQTGSPDPLSVGYSKEGKLTVAEKQDFTGAIVASTVFSALQSALATVQTYLSRIVALETAVPLKAPLASPTFTGAVVVPAPTAAMHAATKQYVDGKVSYVPNLTSSNKVQIVFGKSAHGGKYYSSMIPLPSADLYTITGLSLAVLNGGGQDIGTTLVVQKSTVGFGVSNDNAVVAGEAAFLNFTISK